jgi:hypothetical protein
MPDRVNMQVASYSTTALGSRKCREPSAVIENRMVLRPQRLDVVNDGRFSIAADG